MYTKVFISLMIILCLLGIISGFVLYFGFDPTYNPNAAIILMSMSMFLASGSLLGLLFLLGKKIVNRGFLYPIAAFRSFRHGLLLSLMITSIYAFYLFDVLTIVTGFLLLCIVFLLELILTKTEDR